MKLPPQLQLNISGGVYDIIYIQFYGESVRNILYIYIIYIYIIYIYTYTHFKANYVVAGCSESVLAGGSKICIFPSANRPS